MAASNWARRRGAPVVVGYRRHTVFYVEGTTMTYDPLRLAIVGCGNISGGYARSLGTRPDKIRLVGAYDVDAARAEAFPSSYGRGALAPLPTPPARSDEQPARCPT